MPRRTPEEERAWQAVRQLVLERDQWRCFECGEKVPREELDVHHVIPRFAGGRDEPSNCVTLCDGCHAGHHPALQVSLARRTIQRWAVRIAHWLDWRRQLPEETDQLRAGLDLFGLREFREGQMDAVMAALRGESVLVIRPTGGGKSICFQMPAVLKGQPASVVISPLKALMVDQVRGLHRKKIPGTYVNGDLSQRERELRMRMLDQRAWSLVYLAPERFGERQSAAAEQELARLQKMRPQFLVIDEAHVIDSWGDSFRLQYGRLGEIRAALGNPPVLAFTATASARTQQRILDTLGVPDARVLAVDVDRPNITMTRVREPDARQRAQIVAGLLERLEAQGAGRLMIFIPTVRVGRDVQKLLADLGYDLPLYYSKLRDADRELLEGRFSGRLGPDLRAIICTNAFGMGLDVPDVRVVVNWQLTSAIEDYVQEFGRAGRDGQPALSILFTGGHGERRLLEWMAARNCEDLERSGDRTPAQTAAVLANKHERIAEMHKVSHKSPECFRYAIFDHLQAPRPRRPRGLAMRLLNRTFSDTSKPVPVFECCDVCNPEVVELLKAGEYEPGLLAQTPDPELAAREPATHEPTFTPPVPAPSPHGRRPGRARRPRRRRPGGSGSVAGTAAAWLLDALLSATSWVWGRYGRQLKRLALIAVALFAIVTVTPMIFNRSGDSEADRDTRRAAQLLRRDLARAREPIRYRRVKVEPARNGTYRACATGRARGGAIAETCLFIDLDGRPGRRAVGRFERRGDHLRCEGLARRAVRRCR